MTVITKGSRKNEEYAVTSIRESEQLHWIKAHGVVDNSSQYADDVERLEQAGIYPIATYSVESTYYDFRFRKRWPKDEVVLRATIPSLGLKRQKSHLLKQSSQV